MSLHKIPKQNYKNHTKKRVAKLSSTKSERPIVLSTWDIGLRANRAAWQGLANDTGYHALTAVEAGARAIESETNCCVGLDGIPDTEGRVTLDASIMDNNYNCGSVAFLEGIRHPVTVARQVMESTPHVLLVGEGAQQFALANGHTLEKPIKQFKDNPNTKQTGRSHDTLGIIAMDSAGQLAGACTTSGLANKLHGRVGDSAIIGAGLYVDNDVGAAVATGEGEEVIRMSGTAMVVEAMRRGLSPEEACKHVIERFAAVLEKQGRPARGLTMAYLAINARGEYGAYSLNPGFEYAVRTPTLNKLVKSKYLNSTA